MKEAPRLWVGIDKDTGQDMWVREQVLPLGGMTLDELRKRDDIPGDACFRVAWNEDDGAELHWYTRAD